jgi:hypothetical protein
MSASGTKRTKAIGRQRLTQSGYLLVSASALARISSAVMGQSWSDGSEVRDDAASEETALTPCGSERTSRLKHRRNDLMPSDSHSRLSLPSAPGLV